jgi:hypothetical protein
MGELERKFDVKIESTEDKVKFPDELKVNLKELGLMDDKGKLKLKGVSPKMLKRMKQEFVKMSSFKRRYSICSMFCMSKFPK